MGAASENPVDATDADGRRGLRFLAIAVLSIGVLALTFAVWVKVREWRYTRAAAEAREFFAACLTEERDYLGTGWTCGSSPALRTRALRFEETVRSGVLKPVAGAELQARLFLGRTLRQCGESAAARAVVERARSVDLEAAADTARFLIPHGASSYERDIRSQRVRLESELARIESVAGSLSALVTAVRAVEWAEGLEAEFDMLTFDLGDVRADAWCALAEAQSAQSDWTGAGASYAEALRADPPGIFGFGFGIATRLAYASLLAKSGESALALEMLRAAHANANEGFGRARRSAVTGFELGRALAAQPAQRSEAIVLLEESLAVRRANACCDLREHVEHAALLARLLAEEGDARGARALFDEAHLVAARRQDPDQDSFLRARDEVLVRANPLQAEAERSRTELDSSSGGDSHDKVNDLNDLGRALRAQGKLAEARPYYEQALAMQRRLAPGDGRGVATLTNNLGLLRLHLGEKAEGIAQLEEALAMRRRLAASDPEVEADVAQTLINLASAEQRDENFEAAFRLENEAVTILKRIHGDADDGDLAIAIDNRAATLADLGRVDEAIAGHLEALAMERRLYPGDDVEVARTLHEIGVCHARLKKFDVAITYYSEALRMRRRLYEGDHELVVESLESIGDAYAEWQDFDRALPVRKEALAMRRRLWPDPLASSARSALDLAVTHHLLADERAALLVYANVVEECTALLPRSLWTLAEAVEGATGVCAKTGTFGDIHPAIRAAGEALQSPAVPKGERRTRCLSVIGAYYAAWNAREPSAERAAAAARFGAAPERAPTQGR